MKQTEPTTPTLKAKGKMEAIAPHMVEHARSRREQSNWLKNKTLGSIRIMTEITIDDRRIALQTGRNLFELKSFGQTLDMSLDKPKILQEQESMKRTFIEERTNPMGDVHFVEVTPDHVTVWEYNPRSSMKWRIA